MSVNPPSSFILTVSSSQMQQFYEKIFESRNLSLKPNEIIFKGKYYLFFTVNIRECSIGEIFLPNLLMLNKFFL